MGARVSAAIFGRGLSGERLCRRRAIELDGPGIIDMGKQIDRLALLDVRQRPCRINPEARHGRERLFLPQAWTTILAHQTGASHRVGLLQVIAA